MRHPRSFVVRRFLIVVVDLLGAVLPMSVTIAALLVLAKL
jgi:hypothetical protein